MKNNASLRRPRDVSGIHSSLWRGVWAVLICSLLVSPAVRAAPEINLESPAGTPLATNSVVGFGGSNTYGERTIPAGLTSVQAVAAGAYHSMALRANGTVAVWGGAGSSLGNNTTTDSAFHLARSKAAVNSSLIFTVEKSNNVAGP